MIKNYKTKSSWAFLNQEAFWKMNTQKFRTKLIKIALFWILKRYLRSYLQNWKPLIQNFLKNLIFSNIYERKSKTKWFWNSLIKKVYRNMISILKIIIFSMKILSPILRVLSYTILSKFKILKNLKKNWLGIQTPQITLHKKRLPILFRTNKLSNTLVWMQAEDKIVISW